MTAWKAAPHDDRYNEAIVPLDDNMDSASARQRAIDYLTTLVADCNDALGASDIWADYAPHDRARSLALFRETRDVASRLLSSLQADLALSQTDWRRVIPLGPEWTDLYKILFSQARHEGDA